MLRSEQKPLESRSLAREERDLVARQVKEL